MANRKSYKKRFLILVLVFGLLSLFLFVGVRSGAFYQEDSPLLSQSLVSAGPCSRWDFSHLSQGYFSCQYTGSSAKAKLQITRQNYPTYTYTLHPGEAMTQFPFTYGSGIYCIELYEQYEGNQYLQLISMEKNVHLSSQLKPFLTSNQYVNFNEHSLSTQIANQLAEEAPSNVALLQHIYIYIASHIAYDDVFANNAPKNYVSNVDETLQTGTGICIDYASLMVAMLRSQGIPSRLVVGVVNENIHHAWVEVYSPKNKTLYEGISSSSSDWVIFDPTFASYHHGGSPNAITPPLSYESYSPHYVY